MNNSVPPALQVLHLEDSPRDAALIKRALERQGLHIELLHAKGRPEFERALVRKWDVILSDYRLPDFDGMAALALCRQRCPGVPFIFVSGALGEETAVEALKLGATDYVLKDGLARLGNAVRRGVDEAQMRRRERAAEEELKAAFKRVRESEARFRSMGDTAPVLIWVAGLDKGCNWFNRGWLEFTGRSMEQEMGYGWLAGVHPDDFERCARIYETAFDERQPFATEYRLRRHDGQYRYIFDQGVPRFEGEGEFVGYIGSCFDITDMKSAEERVREAALHDALTGLPSRALLFDYGRRMLAGAKRAHGGGALLFIDLDCFKPINDSYGHEVGDQMLCEVARRLQASTRAGDIAGRLGGDEFLVLVPGTQGGHRTEAVAQHLLHEISRPYVVGARELAVTPSIGISYYPEHGEDMDRLIHAADQAMYFAKQSGRANYKIYSPEMERRAGEALALEATIRQGLAQGGFELHYQPIIDMRSGCLGSVEALLRLRSIEGEPIDTQRFIAVAESTGLIGEIGEWAAAEACRQHAAWLAQGLPPVTIAINVSPLQFRRKAFAERLAAIVEEARIDPAKIVVEVTESTVMGSVDEAIEILGRLKSCGMKVALDDFGTGYSSLSHLSNLPLDKLKVDQSFVRRISHDKTSRAITEAIVALGRTLKLEIVAEGIESEESLEYLRSHGCDQAQGYLFSRPLPAAEFVRWYTPNRNVLEEAESACAGTDAAIADVSMLAVVDQPADLQAVRNALADLGLNLLTAQSMTEAVDKARERDLAVVLIDIGRNGIETVRRLRQEQRHTHTPILLVTAREQDVAGAYQAGAIDYLQKPLLPAVLRAKVAAFAEMHRKHQERRIHAALDASHRQQHRDRSAHERAAYYDALTGLPGPRLIEERLEQEIAHSTRQGERLALLRLNLDRFKQVNESIGHHLGDALLRQAAERLRRRTRLGDFVGRIGGDEFGILLTGLGDQGSIAAAIEQCVGSISARPFELHEQELHITASAGISVFPDDSDCAATLLEHASLALHRAKTSGRNNTQFYAREMSERVRQRVDTEKALRSAIDKDELLLHYQPKLDCAQQRFLGVEALVRWPRDGRLYTPGAFIDVAEASGLALPLGLWVLRNGLEQLGQWDELGLPPLRLAVNLSLRQLLHPCIAADIERVLGESGISAHRLELEVSEPAAMHDLARTAVAIGRLREIGIHLALDDFGIGFSSPRLLRELKFDTLKLDHSLINGMTRGDVDLAFMRSVIAMTHNLRMQAVAEGVETREQLGMLRAESCDMVQGFLISAPVAGAALTEVIGRERELIGDLLAA